MAKILVVDDEADLQALIRQKFRKEIRSNQYEFFFAENGKEALDIVEDIGNIDMVLSDINMPQMDGLTLLSKLTEKSPLIKTVMVSAYGDMENIRAAMNGGAFDFITKPINFEDFTRTIEKTIKYTDQIKNTIKAIKENNILKMYVDHNVLNFMNSREFESTLMKNEVIDATVVFMDISGFTAICENAPPNVAIKIINTYFDIMVKSIVGEDGLVDKFLGDAVMAVFKGENHLERAIRVALASRMAINELPELNDGGQKYKPQVSIGMKSGEMISGNIGSDSLKRLDYTVIGDTVNTASRLQDIAQPNQIAVSEACYEKVKDRFKFKKIGLITLKNKSKAMMVYEVLE